MTDPAKQAKSALPGLAFLFALAAAAAVPASAQDVAAEPQRVCDALKQHGLATSPWATNDDAFQGAAIRNWRCLSEPLPIPGAGGGGFVTALNYFAEGRLRERVETIRLVLNLHQPATRAAGAARFAELAGALFANLGLAAPLELAEALAAARPQAWRPAYGDVRFEVWRRPIERLRLTIDLSPGRRRP